MPTFQAQYINGPADGTNVLQNREAREGEHKLWRSSEATHAYVWRCYGHYGWRWVHIGAVLSERCEMGGRDK